MPLAINEQEKFNEIVKEALAKSANFPRWQNAINKAVVQIELNGCFMEYDKEANHLVIWSQMSNQIYSANGTCQCVAFTEHGHPCWHRAAARLVRLYFDLPSNPSPKFPSKVSKFEAQSTSPYLKPSGKRDAFQVGRIRI